MSLDFQLAPGGYVYRALRKTDPLQRGFDVYALQTALNDLVLPTVEEDGVFGTETHKAVLIVQATYKLDVDGIAGVATQQKVSSIICRRVRKAFDLPNGLPYGIAEHESGLILGNHTPPYPDGSRDCGIVQRNTNYTPMAYGFVVPESVWVCGQKIVDYHNKYKQMGLSERRAWELACGSWNAPAWTDRLARGEYLPPDYTARIEAYISEVTAYVDWEGV